ncbi:MAG: hypothetical protein RLZZ293_220 [Pseudomonadota bacterium]|jgi:segregation and condensation protein A
MTLISVNQQPWHELPKDLYIPPQALQIFLEMFEGPLDLLLYLIRKQNLDILQIPIVKISQQYISYIQAMQTLNMELAGEYLLMAAMLIDIKARFLLPKPVISEDSEEEFDDPRQELVKRLIEYEQIKLASQQLNQLPQANRDFKWLQIAINDSIIELPEVKPLDLQKMWHSVILRSITLHNNHQIKRQELSVREQMTYILRELDLQQRCEFFDLLLEYNLSYVVVNFIAILELGKEQMISLTQIANGEIWLELV